jgi:hypothetical protein
LDRASGFDLVWQAPNEEDDAIRACETYVRRQAGGTTLELMGNDGITTITSLRLLAPGEPTLLVAALSPTGKEDAVLDPGARSAFGCPPFPPEVDVTDEASHVAVG